MMVPQLWWRRIFLCLRFRTRFDVWQVPPCTQALNGIGKVLLPPLQSARELPGRRRL